MRSASMVPAQVETQFLLLELEGEASGTTSSTASAAAGSGAGPAQDDPAAPAYALLLPLIDGGKFRATLRPPK